MDDEKVKLDENLECEVFFEADYQITKTLENNVIRDKTFLETTVLETLASIPDTAVLETPVLETLASIPDTAVLETPVLETPVLEKLASIPDTAVLETLASIPDTTVLETKVLETLTSIPDTTVLETLTSMSDIPDIPDILDKSLIDYSKNYIKNKDIFKDNINLDQITNKLNYNKNNHIPKITFTNSNLNEIKSLVTFNNDININSINSDSDFSYTQNINKYNPINTEQKQIKNIKNTNNRKKNPEIDEIDYVYNKIQDNVRYMDINRTNYIIVICKAVEIIENYKELKNNINKKDIITKALNRLITIDLDLCDFDKKIFILSISNLIDLIVNTTKEVYDKYKHKDNIVIKNHLDDIILAKPGQIINSLIDKLTTIIIKKRYCLDKILVNMAALTNILMILVDKYVYLSGIEKKIIVLQAINNFISERLQYIIEVDEFKKKEVIMMLDTIPLTIDLIVTLKKGKYKINKKNEVYKNITDKKKWFCF